MKARRARGLAAATTTVAVLTATLSGCVTVHGEEAVVPTVSKGEAQRVLKHFTAKNNQANESYDAQLNTTIEAGALGAIDQAGLKSREAVQPGGNEAYEPLRLTDARFLIPKQAGWPKFFVADTDSNRDADSRWVFVFQRNAAGDPWKATYLSVLDPSEMPEFATDGEGNARAVPAGEGSGLTVPPGEMSEAYVRYLQDGSGDFAAGPDTDERRDKRKAAEDQPGQRNEFVDQAAVPPQFAPFGLRTKDGGALVFFGSHHFSKQTFAKGHTPKVKNKLVRALMTGTPKESVTYVRVSEQAVTVPPKKRGGEITFLNRIDGLTRAKGE